MRSERSSHIDRPLADRQGRSPETVRVWLLGGFRVSVESRAIPQSEWRLKKAANLVKLLALAPIHRLHREQVMDLLWPDSGRRAASNNLRKTLHTARKVFDPATGSRYLASENESLVLCPSGVLWVDVEAFEEAAATARRTRDPAAYRSAIDLYVDDLLPEDRYEEWVEEPRRRLQQTYLSLLLGLARLHEERGDYERGIEALRRVLAEEPTLEEAHVGLMRLYALCDRRAEALAQYERLRGILARELDTEPTTTIRRLREDIAAGRLTPTRLAGPSPAEPLDVDKHNLPAPRTSFVGRERELLEVKRALTMTRLLTLTGAGGSGKTRLALEVARDLVGIYPDGVWLVELAGLSQPELVTQRVAAVLKVHQQPGRPLAATLADYLSTKNLMLIIDNCEHLIDAVARLMDSLLNRCPRLRVLATSREALDVAGEISWLVPSLSVPDPQELPSAERLLDYESVQLFVNRARHRNPSFVLTPNSAKAVAEICERLGGIPLALELAAARVGMLSVGQIAQKLEDSLKLLRAGGRTAPPRHQTLEGTLDWSYRLLSEPERKLFRRLSAFVGGWTLEAAEAVGADNDEEKNDVLDMLSRLVAKSLVVVESGEQEPSRYRMLEPVRQYARKLLEESGEAGTVQNRHAALFLALVEQAYPELRGPQQVEWFHRLAQENDNLRAAMTWLLSEGDVETAVCLGWPLWPFWHFRGQHREGRSLMEAALESESDLPPVLRIRANVTAGIMAYGQADTEATEKYGKKLVELSQQVDGKACAEGWGRLGLGLVAMNRQSYKEAAAHLEATLPLFLECDEAVIAAQVRSVIGVVYLLQGDHDRAASMFEEGLAFARHVGDRVGTYNALFSLAQMALTRGDLKLARSRFSEGMILSEQIGDRANVAYCLEGLAAVAGTLGRADRSIRLFGAADRLFERVGVPVWDFYKPDRSLYERIVTEQRVVLGEASFDKAWAEGRAMTLREAAEYALSDDEKPFPSMPPLPEQAPTRRYSPKLSRREQEVVALVARGMTNRQIAANLSISEHTAATHVARILKKLDLRSRAQIGSWLSEKQSSTQT